MEQGQSLGTLIKIVRKRKGESLKTLADKVEKSEQWLSAIERGDLPSLDFLLKLHEELVPEINPQLADEDLSLWLLKWLEEQLTKNNADKDSINKVRLEAVQKLRQQHSTAGKARVRSGSLPTLDNFPSAFGKFVIICGDRRESPPKTRGDIFADSFSVVDIMELSHLIEKVGEAEILTDKLFVLLSERELREKFGDKNLILIGSPVANLASRAINKYCTFRFDIQDDAKKFDEKLRVMTELNSRSRLQVFWEMVLEWKAVEWQKNKLDIKKYRDKTSGGRVSKEEIEELYAKVADLLGGYDAKQMKNLFRIAGFVDIADGKRHGTFTREDNDFGVISMSKNPYSDNNDCHCILIAGIHAPGTYQGIHMLINGDFKTHPLGGVFEVTLDPNTAWGARIKDSEFKWQTKGYNVSDVLNNLQNANSIPAFSSLSANEISELISYIRRFDRGLQV